MKKSIIFLAAIAAFFSCAKDNSVNNTPTEETFSVTLTASAPSSEDVPSPASADTKTTLVDGNNKKFVHWSPEDAIRVLFFPNTTTYNASYSGPSNVFNSNVNGAPSASADFTCKSWSWGSKVAEQGISASLQPTGIAVYPSSAVATSSKPQDKRKNCNTEISFVLPLTQNAVENNIESGLNFSWANVELSSFPNGDGEKTTPHLRFNNACAIIELTMPSTLDKKVTSISLVSNSGVSLTGKGSVRLTGYNNMVADPFGVDVTEGDGVTLLSDANGFKAGAKYYAVVWPGNHTSGLTITFTAEDGSKATKTTGAVELTASKVKPYTFNKGLVFESASYDYVYSDGKLGNDPNPSGKTVVGVIFFNGNPKDKFNNSEMGGTFKGLAISLKDYVICWGTSSNTAPNWKYPSSVGLVKGTVANYNIGGFNTRYVWLTSGYNNLDIYKTNYGTLPEGVSLWYLPAPIEWKYIAENLSKINSKLSAVGGQVINLGTSMADGYWLPLAEANSYDAYVVHGPENSLYFEDNDWTYKYSTHKARPIFAF